MVDCEPNALLEASRCYRCIPRGMRDSVAVLLLCEWLNGYDPDAQRYFNAAGITNLRQKSAINQFVLGLKSAGVPSLWNSEVLIYPFVGGTAASHAVNLKSPGTFDLTYPVAGLDHNARGMKGDGIAAYANTGYKPRTELLPSTDFRVMLYADESDTVGVGQFYFGSYDAAPTTRFGLGNNNVANAVLNLVGTNPSVIAFVAAGAVLGQVGPLAQEYAINGGALSASAYAPTLLTNNEVFLLAKSLFGVPDAGTYSTARISGFSMGSRSLSAPEWTDYYGLWQALQTSLGRPRP